MQYNFCQVFPQCSIFFGSISSSLTPVVIPNIRNSLKVSLDRSSQELAGCADGQMESDLTLAIACAEAQKGSETVKPTEAKLVTERTVYWYSLYMYICTMLLSF